jgi:hypothetical protein
MDSPLIMDGQTIIPKGGEVTLKLTKVASAGNIKGASEVDLQLDRLYVSKKAYTVTSNTFQSVGKSEGTKTAKQTGIGAGIGAVIGAIAGGGKGAAIGAGVGGVLVLQQPQLPRASRFASLPKRSSTSGWRNPSPLRFQFRTLCTVGTTKCRAAAAPLPGTSAPFAAVIHSQNCRQILLT